MITPTDILLGKILIVDDQEANVALLEQMLRGAGYLRVTSTMDSGLVSELHLVHRYDLILLDLQMPGMDGFQVMENLKQVETEGYLPVLVITAQPAHKQRALKVGARDFISKPLDVAEVLLRVRNMLEVRLLHTETKVLCDRLLAEQKISERLLLDVLPASIAERLKGRAEVKVRTFTEVITEGYAEVTILFSDLQAFTQFSEGASAEVLLGVLEDISARLDGSIPMPVPDPNQPIRQACQTAAGHADDAGGGAYRSARKALTVLDAVDRFNQHSRYQLYFRLGFKEGAPLLNAPGKRNIVYDL